MVLGVGARVGDNSPPGVEKGDVGMFGIPKVTGVFSLGMSVEVAVTSSFFSASATGVGSSLVAGVIGGKSTGPGNGFTGGITGGVLAGLGSVDGGVGIPGIVGLLSIYECKNRPE